MNVLRKFGIRALQSTPRQSDHQFKQSKAKQSKVKQSKAKQSKASIGNYAQPLWRPKHKRSPKKPPTWKETRPSPSILISAPSHRPCEEEGTVRKQRMEKKKKQEEARGTLEGIVI